MTITLLPLTPMRDFGYWGTRGNWLVALTQHRDSDQIDRSNWSVITEEMFRVFGHEDVAIESASHWAVGWTEHLLVRPGSKAAEEAVVWQLRLQRYPLADEEHYSLLEYDEEWCVRCDRGIRNQHPLNGCTFRSESEADDIKWKWDQRRKR